MADKQSLYYLLLPYRAVNHIHLIFLKRKSNWPQIPVFRFIEPNRTQPLFPKDGRILR